MAATREVAATAGSTAVAGWVAEATAAAAPAEACEAEVHAVPAQARRVGRMEAGAMEAKEAGDSAVAQKAEAAALRVAAEDLRMQVGEVTVGWREENHRLSKGMYRRV